MCLCFCPAKKTSKKCRRRSTSACVVTECFCFPISVARIFSHRILMCRCFSFSPIARNSAGLARGRGGQRNDRAAHLRQLAFRPARTDLRTHASRFAFATIPRFACLKLPRSAALMFFLFALLALPRSLFWCLTTHTRTRTSFPTRSASSPCPHVHRRSQGCVGNEHRRNVADYQRHHLCYRPGILQAKVLQPAFRH